LGAAHAKGIIHRDLKPENLFLTFDGRVKILDFGLARIRPELPQGESPVLTETGAGTVMGTVGYMSPEQVRGSPVDATSDIFSFGCVLYEMAAGRQAFLRETPAQTMTAILEDEPRPVASFGKEVPSELDRLIGRCLEKNPRKRFRPPYALAFVRKNSLHAGIPPPPAATPGPRPRRAGGMAAIGLILAAAAFMVWPLGVAVSSRPVTAPVKSIAVLPLENLSGDPSQEYFADGMTDALIGDLTKIGALRVVSRTSVMRYKGSRKLLPEIAHDLSVDTVLAGSVMRSGERVRIAVQLIDAAYDRNLWSESYERDIPNVLGLQRDVAQAIAREIRIKLTPLEQARLADARPVDAEAHDAYMRGLYHLARRAEGNRDKALEYFQQAIEKDPSFAPAHAALATTYSLFGNYPKMKEAALNALRLDEHSAEAYAALGFAKMNNDWDWQGAEQNFKRAIALNPQSMTAHHWYSHFLTARVRHKESLAEAQKALDLEPLNMITSEHMGWTLHFARQYDRAVEHYRRMLAMEPNFALGHLRMGHTYEQMGLQAEAIAEFETAKQLSGGGLGSMDMGTSSQEAGEPTRRGRYSQN